MSPLYMREFHAWMRKQVRAHRLLLRFSSGNTKVQAHMLQGHRWVFRLKEGRRYRGPTEIQVSACAPYGGAGLLLHCHNVTSMDQRETGTAVVYVAHEDRDLAVPLIHRIANGNSTGPCPYGQWMYASRVTHRPTMYDLNRSPYVNVAAAPTYSLTVGPPETPRPQHRRPPAPGEWVPAQTPWFPTYAYTYEI